MSCEVAALPLQAHANYGTWSIDLESIDEEVVLVIYRQT